MILVIAIPVTVASSVFLPTNEVGLDGFANFSVFLLWVQTNWITIHLSELSWLILIRRWVKTMEFAIGLKNKKE